MADLATCAAMGADPALRPRVAAAVIRLAIAVISEPAPGEEAPLPERTAHARRRGYALDVTTDVPTYTTRAQYAIACWGQSELADVYAAGGADAVTDDAIMGTLAAVWTATGGA